MSKKQKKPAAPAVKTVKTKQKQNMFEYVAVNVICLFVFLSFGYIALMAFFQTSVIDPLSYSGEKILYQTDIIPLNIIFTVLAVIVMFALKNFICKRIDDNKKMRRLAIASLLTVLGLIALALVFSVIISILQKDANTGLFAAISKGLLAPSESIFYPLNFLLLALFAGVMIAMWRFYSYESKRLMTVVEVLLAVFVVMLGMMWVLNVRSVPAADSYNIYEAASGAAKGDYHSMHNFTNFYNSKMYDGYSYFQFYPFQLGFVAFCELIYRIFGTDSYMPVQIINVLCVGAAYFALARITRLLFRSRRVEMIAVIMLALCIQPVLFCTFMYGNIIGMCLALWASLLLIKYFQTGQYRWIYPAGALLVLATLVKYNNMIYLVAFVIMLVIHIVKKKRWQSAVIAAALIAAVLGSNALVIKHYESRADVEFTEGVSQVQYLDLGLQESHMAPGWYTSIGLQTYKNYYLVPKFNGVPDASAKNANDKSWEDIEKRMDDFSDAEYTLDFFSKKILSQWNEPTYESIWISKVKPHTASEADAKRLGTPTIGSEQVKGLTQSVYDKSTGQALELHFNFYMQIIYILFAVGIYMLFVRKKTNIETVLLPLVLLGAFGYHLLFEGKSQYVLTYIPLLIPTAAYALHVILNGKYTHLKKFVAKLTHVPSEYKDINRSVSKKNK